MYKLFKRLAGISVFYSFANSIEAFSPFILAIILTRFLAPQEYGIWVLFISLVAFLRPVVNLTIQDALKMQFYELDRARRATFVVSAFYLSSGSALILACVVLLFNDALATVLRFPAPWVIAIVITAYLYVNFYFVLTFNQFAENRTRFIKLQLIQAVSGLAIVTLLVYQGWSWQGVVVGKITGLLLACIVGVVWLAADLNLNLKAHSKNQIRTLIKFGLIYLPTGFGLVAVPLTDRLIISHLLGMSENGLYGVAALFGAALFVAVNGFLHAWMPWLFQRLREPQGPYRKEVSIVSLAFVFGLPIIGSCFYLVSELAAPVLIGASFASAFPLIPWAIAGTVSMGYFYHNQAFLHFKKAVLPMSLSSLSCIVLNAVLSYFGAVHYGVVGVLVATVAAFLFSALMSGGFILCHYNLVGEGRVKHAQ